MATTNDGVSEIESLERGIATLRIEADRIVGELSARAHAMFGLRARLREDRWIVVGLGAGLAATTALLIGWQVRRAQRARRLPARIGRRLHRWRLSLSNPAALAPERRARLDWSRLLAPPLAAAASAGAKALASRLLPPPEEGPKKVRTS